MTGGLHKTIAAKTILVLAIVVAMSACESAYYNAMERFGLEKRDILIDRVKEARKSQKEAKEEFTSALDQFRATVAFDGGDLERQYDQLSAAYERAEAQAEEVRDRVDAVENVGEALFSEWKSELSQYSDRSLRSQSEQQMRATRRQFDSTVLAMNRAAKSMDPVLEVFKDRVLYLKHNLNARAIAALKTENARLQTRVDTLIREMETAIAEADRFIASMDAG
jgi:ElaB/YqjD/DUF883 family membrane-anchored ribosome-binding protein